MFSDDARKRVNDALNTHPQNILDKVKQLNTSIELHHFVITYNCNDGLIPLKYIATRSDCDLGTALRIYWDQADTVLFRDDVDRHSDENWNSHALIEEIEKRVKSGFYKGSEIDFSAQEYLGWSDIKLKRLKLQWKNDPPFPEEMMFSE